MKVAVWDSYVKQKDGSVLHFDIIVPETQKDSSKIYSFGKKYLDKLGLSASGFSTEECQYCHIEEASAEIVKSIKKQDYYILEMDNIPAELGENPSRSKIIMHLRGHYPKYRFEDFSTRSKEDVEKILKEVKKAN